MKPGLSLRISQQLALTPLLQQSIRLLQLSTLELDSEVEQMLDDNPFLERDDDGAARDEFGLARADTRVSEGDRISENADDASADTNADTNADTSIDTSADFGEHGTQPENWDGDGSMELAPDDGEWGGEAPARGADASHDDDDADPAERVSGHESLAEHLHRQALALRLAPEDAAALRFLIESLNDDGYLEDSPAQLAATLAEDEDSPEQIDELIHRFTLALKLLQSLEPAGVGARDLAECLSLQLRGRQAERGVGAAEQALLATALQICAQHGAIELLARRDAKKMTQLIGQPEDAVRAAMQTIARLDPKPGRQFADVRHNIILPDVIVSAIGSGSASRFRVRINPDVVPRLRIQDAYAKALRGVQRADRQELTQRLQEARWFVKNIQQRFDTILRVATAIVERQRGFFIHGEVAMRPLVQHDLAEELGLHDSTISRVTNAKYMATPRGTFELKYFFGSALNTEAGGNASSTAVRALIKQLIAAENPHKPLSDQQIADILKDQGIDCARRTVAKYREHLRIPVANLRRAAA
ncbi:MAG: RNA polymerase factor sigma-54 [Burkholderiaceae bacterium]|jgi:RNA polymerase sigma-54 factor|nr:RNA polymerase factor sigma-54 [Burkholderiaceae bacterium]